MGVDPGSDFPIADWAWVNALVRDELSPIVDPGRRDYVIGQTSIDYDQLVAALVVFVISKVLLDAMSREVARETLVLERLRLQEVIP